MKFPIPSFRTQIILLVLFFLVNSVLFYRNYFLDSFAEYSQQVTRLNVETQISNLHQRYSQQLPDSTRLRFRRDIEDILSTEKQSHLLRKIFKDELHVYSSFIFTFLSLVVLILFFISFNLITRPLQRLQAATDSLRRGNWEIQVKESRFSPLNDLILSFNNMTRELKRSRERLIQAEKEAAWRDMARVLAHEIKNPLTPMRLSLERLERKYTDQADDLATVFQRVAAVLHDEIDNLQSLATEFSQFARLPQTQPRDFDFREHILSLIEPYRDMTRIAVTAGESLPAFHGDQTLLKQVYTNVLQNAIQSGATNITITVNVKQHWIIKIADDGKGIPPENIDKIFDPYFTRREKGTGLGLAIVRRIVENHDGTISVASTVGKGTEFTLTFPLKKRNE